MTDMELSRREREKLKQRQDIIVVAEELFSQHGFHNVSMREIAERAEFAIGTLYNFFESKEEIYHSIMEERVHRLHAVLLVSLDDNIGDEVAKIRNYVRVKIEMFMQSAHFIRIYLNEIRGSSCHTKSSMPPKIRESRDKMLKLIADIFESGMEKGLFNRIAEPYQLAVALDALCHNFLFLWLDDPDEHPFPEAGDAIINILFKGLLPD